jgi:hypothetical protein
MYKLFKWLMVLAFVGLLLGLGSYAVAWLKVGSFIGPTKPLSSRSVSFAFQGVDELNGRRFVWVIKYSASRLPRVRQATFYVSPTGDMVATNPANLDRMIEAWEKTRLP